MPNREEGGPMANHKPIVEQITSAPEYKAFMAALEAQRKIGDARKA